MKKVDYKITINRCARCDGNHVDLDLFWFDTPFMGTDGTMWTRWATCPTSNDPILIRQYIDSCPCGKAPHEGVLQDKAGLPICPTINAVHPDVLADAKAHPEKYAPATVDDGEYLRTKPPETT